MREKTLKLVITFHTTAEAMAAEKYCKNAGIPGRLIPVPRQIHAGCGLAWAAPPENEEMIRSGFATAGIDWEACQTLMI